MNQYFVLWVVATVWSLLAATQANLQSGTTVPRIELKVSDRVLIANSGKSLGGVGPMRCDAQGNVYVRPASGNINILRAPILRISSDGQKTTQFDIATVSDIKDAGSYNINDFVVRKDGTVVVLAGAATKEDALFVDVVQIDPEDKTPSVTRVDSELRPSHILPLPSGTFLLEGIMRSTQGSGKEKRQSAKPFTGIFDSQGRLVKEVKLPGDVKIPDIDSSNRENPDLSNLEAVYLSHFVAADDGTVYILRNGSAPKFYVLSSTGEVIRSFPLSTPAADVRASTLFYAGGRLAIEFSLTDAKEDFGTDALIRVIDAQDGHVLWDDVLGKDVHGIPTCYNGQDFTLFYSDAPNRRLGLLKVSPH